MLEIEFTKAIKKDLKKYQFDKEALASLQEIICLLSKGEPLPSRNKDHNLTGNWLRHRECHVKNDLLLIYKVEGKILFLTRFGSHSELF